MNINERVDQISATIQELRQASADGRRSRQLIDSLFRTVHTLKAAASAEGLIDVSRTAHEFEDVLHSLRTGKITLDAEVLRVFDETIGALRNRSDATSLTRFNQATYDAPGTHRQLPIEFANLKEDERHRALAALREGANLYDMQVEFEVTNFDERFRELTARLEEVAEVISTSATMSNNKIHFQVFYASNSEKFPVQTAARQAVLAGQTVSTTLEKNITFVVRGEEVLLERAVGEVLTDALVHLVRNAVDHGIETEGTITIDLSANEICVTDNGRGIGPEHLPLIFQPGFSIATTVTEVSGRGVGLDAVKTAVEEIGGAVTVTSEPAKGSTFKIKLPNPSKIPNPSSDA